MTGTAGTLSRIAAQTRAYRGWGVQPAPVQISGTTFYDTSGLGFFQYLLAEPVCLARMKARPWRPPA